MGQVKSKAVMFQAELQSLKKQVKYFAVEKKL